MSLTADLERHLREREEKITEALVPASVVLEEGMALGYALAVFYRQEITLADLQEVAERIKAARAAALSAMRAGFSPELH